jgi:hypothetical protein
MLNVQRPLCAPLWSFNLILRCLEGCRYDWSLSPTNLKDEAAKVHHEFWPKHMGKAPSLSSAKEISFLKSTDAASRLPR